MQPSTMQATNAGETIIRINQEAIQKFNEETPAIIKMAGEYAIENVEDYENSLPLLEGIAGRIARIVEFFTPTKKQAFELHKTICAQEATMTAPYLKASELLKTKRYDFRQAAEKAGQAEEHRQADAA